MGLATDQHKFIRTWQKLNENEKIGKISQKTIECCMSNTAKYGIQWNKMATSSTCYWDSSNMYNVVQYDNADVHTVSCFILTSSSWWLPIYLHSYAVHKCINYDGIILAICNTSSLNFLMARHSSWHPTNNAKALKECQQLWEEIITVLCYSVQLQAMIKIHTHLICTANHNETLQTTGQTMHAQQWTYGYNKQDSNTTAHLCEITGQVMHGSHRSKHWTLKELCQDPQRSLLAWNQTKMFPWPTN